MTTLFFNVKTLWTAWLRFTPKMAFQICVDHSCGHDQQREDGLDSSKMKKLYGGKQRIPHSSKIVSQEGYLGPFSSKLKVGDAKKIVFCETDEGPFWLTPAQREKRRCDERTGEFKTIIRSDRQLMVEIIGKMPSMQMKDLKTNHVKTLRHW